MSNPLSKFSSWIGILSLVVACSAGISSTAYAVFYHSNFQTADLHPGMTTYEVSLEPIIYMGGALSGFGMAGRLLLPLTEDFAGNISVGTGAIPFQFDSHVQYSIYPDFDNQIAFSVGGGMSYLRKDTFNHVTLYAYPIISKTFRWGGFILTPYALAPIGVSFFHDTMDVPLRVSLGAKATNPELKHVFFYLEGGVGILNAPHLISFGIAFQFNSV